MLSTNLNLSAVTSNKSDLRREITKGLKVMLFMYMTISFISDAAFCCCQISQYLFILLLQSAVLPLLCPSLPAPGDQSSTTLPSLTVNNLVFTVISSGLTFSIAEKHNTWLKKWYKIYQEKWYKIYQEKLSQ